MALLASCNAQGTCCKALPVFFTAVSATSGSRRSSSDAYLRDHPSCATAANTASLLARISAVACSNVAVPCFNSCLKSGSVTGHPSGPSSGENSTWKIRKECETGRLYLYLCEGKVSRHLLPRYVRAYVCSRRHGFVYQRSCRIILQILIHIAEKQTNDLNEK